MRLSTKKGFRRNDECADDVCEAVLALALRSRDPWTKLGATRLPYRDDITTTCLLL